jgi:hypothetical protein
MENPDLPDFMARNPDPVDKSGSSTPPTIYTITVRPQMKLIWIVMKVVTKCSLLKLWLAT